MTIETFEDNIVTYDDGTVYTFQGSKFMSGCKFDRESFESLAEAIGVRPQLKREWPN